MPREILLPELAESVVEGEIQKWLVAEGDRVALDQPLVEVMTDKATVELPSPCAGVLWKLLVREGQVVPVHAPIALLLEEGESAETATAATAASGTAPRPDGSLFKPSEHREAIKNPFLASRTRATPVARRMARELGVDLGRVTGSGPLGRVRVEDVEAAAGRAGAARGGDVAGFPPPVPYHTPKGYQHLEERKPLRGLRRAIARQMVASHLYTVRTLVVDEADFTALGELRARRRAEAESQGVRLAYLPFLFRALGHALERFPELNCSLDERTQEIVFKRYCNLGMAVATEDGLVVPVVRDVRAKSLLALARETQDLAQRAQQRRLTPEELTGSSFTVTSIGKVGTLFSFPIINVPDAAILGVHTIKRRPVGLEESDGAGEQVAIRSMAYLSRSFDHRLVEGATAATFLQELIRLLERPDQTALEA